jgi:hypothetical protein
MTCGGCKGGFDLRQPCHFVCSFSKRGFPFSDGRVAESCGTRYHATCIQAGRPFESRTATGLTFPHHLPLPHFVCESCTVRIHLDRELHRTGRDVVLLMMERMRMIDMASHWADSTMKKYGGKLGYLQRFGIHYGVKVLDAPALMVPPQSPAVPLAWATLLYSLRQTRRRDGEMANLKYSAIRGLRSAASWYYRMDMLARYPRRVMQDKTRRGMILDYVSPTDELGMTLGASAMAQRLGTEASKSWALSHVHIAYIDAILETRYWAAETTEALHEISCAATINLLAYLGWLRGGEVFGVGPTDVTLIRPHEGETRGLPEGIGAVEVRLAEQTKGDRTVTADVVVAYTTLTDLSVGTWMARLMGHTPVEEGVLFSTRTKKRWDSHYFRTVYAHPLLEQQRASGEPTLRAFSTKPGQRIADKVVSIHSWKRGGRSKVSRAARAREPDHALSRRATESEIYEHGRWSKSQAGESMPQRYNQWGLDERVGITLFCM